MANYTKPQDPEHEDTPQDWLNSCLVFAATLSCLLQETEGVVIDIKGDMKVEGDDTKKVIVFKKDHQIHIYPIPEDDDRSKNLPEGTMIWMHAISPN